jgi:hypothetical protein
MHLWLWLWVSGLWVTLAGTMRKCGKTQGRLRLLLLYLDFAMHAGAALEPMYG